MKSLIIGNGSAGQRHARVLEAMGHEVGIVSRRDPRGLFFVFGYDYAVIATETSDHHRALCDLAATGFTGKVMVEKPLFHQPMPMPENNFAAIGVGYPLRHWLPLSDIRENVRRWDPTSAQIHAGHYLPHWRPGRDYRETYSAWPALGGGVLRDLSHELEYANWLFGPWKRLVATGGHFHQWLDIHSDDTFAILAEFEDCPAVTIQLNYVDRPLIRDLTVTWNMATARLDFRDAPRGDELTHAMHVGFLEGIDPPCTLAEGERVVAMIAAAEQSNSTGKWISA